jgi:hypothetical protein
VDSAVPHQRRAAGEEAADNGASGRHVGGHVGLVVGPAMLAMLAMILAACSASTPQTSSSHHSSIPPRTTARVAVVTRTKLSPPGSRCSRDKIELGVGTEIPAAYLATLQFIDDSAGVGVTASGISCIEAHGDQTTEAFPVWLVTSTDAGHIWRTTGSLLPRALDTGFVSAMAFSSTARGWLEADGHLGFTSDAGLRWRVVDVGQVTALDASGGTVDALVNQSSIHGARVIRLSTSGAVERATPFLPPSSFRNALVQTLAVSPQSGAIVVAVPDTPHDRLFVIGDGLTRWVARGAPCEGELGPGEVIAVAGVLAAECNLGTSMNANAKAFVVSDDAGRTWHQRSIWPNLNAPNPSGLPRADFFSFAALSPTTFFMATTLGVGVSRDAGAHWQPIDLSTSIPGNSSFGAELFFSDARHGWLLLEGEGLFATVDGVLWTAG